MICHLFVIVWLFSFFCISMFQNMSKFMGGLMNVRWQYVVCPAKNIWEFFISSLFLLLSIKAWVAIQHRLNASLSSKNFLVMSVSPGSNFEVTGFWEFVAWKKWFWKRINFETLNEGLESCFMSRNQVAFLSRRRFSAIILLHLSAVLCFPYYYWSHY